MSRGVVRSYKRKWRGKKLGKYKIGRTQKSKKGMRKTVAV